MKRDNILRYFETRGTAVRSWLRHQQADTLLDKVTFRWVNESMGRKKEKRDPALFGDQVRFLAYLQEQAARATKKPVLVLGDSGLGKTWLLMRTFVQMAEQWSDGLPVPLYLSLRGQTFSLSTKAERALSLLPAEARANLQAELQSKNPVKNLKERLQSETNLELSDGYGASLVLFLDGLNEMPVEGQRNLFTALKAGFPEALWVISSQPHVLESVDEVKRHKGLEAGWDPWDFFLVQSAENRLDEFLKVLLPQEPNRQELDRVALAEYFKKLSPGICRNPRYLGHVCDIIRNRPKEAESWPTKLGEIFDEAITRTLAGHLIEADIHEADVASRVARQKVLLGCLAIYQMLSGGKLLSWEDSVTGVGVWEWMAAFEWVGVLPKDVIKEELDQLRQRGPWGNSATGGIALDHDTTRDYAAACLLKHLLAVWKPGEHRGFRDWLVLNLLVHEELGKSLPILTDLTSEKMLQIDERMLSLVDPSRFNSFAVFHSSPRRALLAKLRSDDQSETDVIKALSGAVGEPEVLQALLPRFEDMQMAGLSAARKAVFVALSAAVWEPKVRQALMERLKHPHRNVRRDAARALSGAAEEPELLAASLAMLEDQHPWIREAASLVLSGVVGQPVVRRALLARLGDAEWSVRWAAAEALSGAVGQSEVRQALLARLNDEDPRVRIGAADALSGIEGEGNPEVLRVMLAKLNEKVGRKHTEFAEAAVKVLSGAVGDPEVRRVLLTKLDDEYEPFWVREAAAAALSAAVGEPEVQQAFLRKMVVDSQDFTAGIIRSQDFVTQEAVAIVLSGAVEQPEVRRALLAMLEDGDIRTRAAAATALSGGVEQPEVRRALLAMLNDGDELVRLSAVRALSKEITTWRRQRLLTGLKGRRPLLSNAESTVCIAPAVAEPEVEQALLAKLEDEKWSVRKAAAEALSGAVSQPEVWQALLARLDDEYFIVRRSAAHVLGCPLLCHTLQCHDAAMCVQYLAKSVTLLDPVRFRQTLHAASQVSKNPSNLLVYRVLHQMRHDLKYPNHVEAFPSVLGELMPNKLSENLPGIPKDTQATALYLTGKSGNALPPVFNLGTFGLSVFLDVIERYQAGEWLPSQKQSLKAIFYSQVCDRMGFHAEEAISRWIGTSENRRIALETVSSGKNDRLRILGDEEVFREIFMQFLGNAVSFCKETVRVTLLTYPYPDHDPTILVRDDGPGIPPDDVEHCFTTSWTSRLEKGGTGKGLSLKIPYKLGLMGFSLYVRDNEKSWHWIRSKDGKTPTPARNPIKRLPKDHERIESQLSGTGAAFLIIQE